MSEPAKGKHVRSGWRGAVKFTKRRALAMLFRNFDTSATFGGRGKTTVSFGCKRNTSAASIRSSFARAAAPESVVCSRAQESGLPSFGSIGPRSILRTAHSPLVRRPTFGRVSMCTHKQLNVSAIAALRASDSTKISTLALISTL